MERATETQWLRWFYDNADFGPAHEDVVDYMKQQFVDETKLELPEDYE